MKTHARILSILLMATCPTIAQVPQMIHYQGRVTVGGTNFDGAGQFQFALVGAGGSPVFWSNGVSTIGLTVSKGLFSVLLGDTNLAGMAQPIPSVVFTNGDVRLRVWFNDGINGTQLLSPDPRIGSVGYAMVAARAETASGFPPGADLSGPRLNIGAGHTLSGFLATIAGGTNNAAINQFTAIGGGYGNIACGDAATIGGGQYNTASNQFTAIGGGYGNTASRDYATVGGGYLNRATNQFATVAGGYGNTASRDYTAVGGGRNNVASGDNTTVGGGYFNTASNAFATVGGGGGNTAGGWAATVGGGDNNTASGYAATVAGGQQNTASGEGGTVGGGRDNTAGGYCATVPGGENNAATNTYSFAAGRNAKAYHPGAFVWGDNHGAEITSTTNDQFTARCSGGVRFFSDWTGSFGVQLAAGGNAWSSISDRNAKENFAPVDGRTVLEKVAAIPVTTWNMKTQDPSIRHIGPMAQDFMAAFDVGEDDRHISTSDADGVALAAIQGLYEMGRTQNEILKEKDARITALEQRLKMLERRIEDFVKAPRPGGI